jgi:hypothetical protein
MATRNVIKGITNSGAGVNTIGGYKSSRYERFEIGFGTIPANGYAAGDTIQFPVEPSSQIIEATFCAAGGTAVNTYPSTNYANAIAVNSNSNVAIDYVIKYKRGTGRVGAACNIKILTS